MSCSFFAIPSSIKIDHLVRMHPPTFAPFFKLDALQLLEHLSALYVGQPLKLNLKALREEICENALSYIQWFTSCGVLTLGQTSRSVTIRVAQTHDSPSHIVVYESATNSVDSYNCLSWELRQQQVDAEFIASVEWGSDC
jgi:hypothetical protein